MTSLGLELHEALREGRGPRLVEAIRKLRALLANLDLGRLSELLGGLLTLLDQIGILPPTAAAADDDSALEAACVAACAGDDESTAQAIDLAGLMTIVKLIVELVRRLSAPRPAPEA